MNYIIKKVYTEEHLIFKDEILVPNGDSLHFGNFDKLCECVLPSGKTVGDWVKETEELFFPAKP